MKLMMGLFFLIAGSTYSMTPEEYRVWFKQTPTQELTRQFFNRPLSSPDQYQILLDQKAAERKAQDALASKNARWEFVQSYSVAAFVTIGFVCVMLKIINKLSDYKVYQG